MPSGARKSGPSSVPRCARETSRTSRRTSRSGFASRSRSGWTSAGSSFPSRLAATLMEGRPLAERVRAQVADEVRELGEIGLATVQVGEDEASTIYLRLKHKAAAEVDIASVDHKLGHEITEDELLELVGQLNADDSLDGILVQLPLPDHIDEARIIAAVDPVKDVDGFHPFNAGQLYLGRPTHVPATPLGIMEA